jgi:hypothetical protein
MGRPAVAALTLVLVASGCQNSSVVGREAADTASDEQARTTPAASPSSRSAPDGTVDVLASCEDTAGDSRGPLDLQKVQAQREDDGSLLFTYTYAGDLPERGDLLFSTLADRVQYAYAIRDGERHAHATIDFLKAPPFKPVPVSGVEDVGEQRARIGFPEGDVNADGLGATAAISLDGNIIDQCTIE